MSLNTLLAKIDALSPTSSTLSGVQAFEKCKKQVSEILQSEIYTQARNSYVESLDLYKSYTQEVDAFPAHMIKPSFSDWLSAKIKVDPSPGSQGSGWMEDINKSEKEKVRYVVRVLRGVSNLRTGGVLSNSHWQESLSSCHLLARMIGESVDEITKDDAEWTRKSIEASREHGQPIPFEDPRRAQVVGHFAPDFIGNVRWNDEKMRMLPPGSALYSHPVVVPSATAIVKLALGMEWDDVEDQARRVAEFMHNILADQAPNS